MTGREAIAEARLLSKKSKRGFRNSKKYFSELDAAGVSQLVSAGVDLALVIEDGLIKDSAVFVEDLEGLDAESNWRGASFHDIVTPESRPKVDVLLTSSLGDGKWRQLSHPSTSGFDIPVNYITVKIGKSGHILALGREMRSVAVLQQRLVKTHQELEREYDRLRHAEARYRDLFDAMLEPVMVIDAESYRVLEANPAAKELFDLTREKTRDPFTELLSKEGAKTVSRAFERAVAVGQSDVDRLKLRRKGEWDIRISAFRQDDAIALIVRFVSGDAGDNETFGRGDQTLASVVESLPDAIVVTSSNLRILRLNSTFMRMIHLVDERRAIGNDLSEWLGRSSTELNMLMSNLKNYGVVKNFATVVRDRFGVEADVEVSAVATPIEDEAVYGFAIRNTARRLDNSPDLSDQLPGSVDQVTSLVGKLPLKEIVRESTDLIERLCIDAALKIADDNRASAAEILGLSRQGLYSKLKRFGIDES